jgi:hypothetical protein
MCWFYSRLEQIYTTTPAASKYDERLKVVIDRNQYFDRNRIQDRNIHVSIPRPKQNRNNSLSVAETETETETETI